MKLSSSQMESAPHNRMRPRVLPILCAANSDGLCFFNDLTWLYFAWFGLAWFGLAWFSLSLHHGSWLCKSVAVVEIGLFVSDSYLYRAVKNGSTVSRRTTYQWERVKLSFFADTEFIAFLSYIREAFLHVNVYTATQIHTHNTRNPTRRRWQTRNWQNGHRYMRHPWEVITCKRAQCIYRLGQTESEENWPYSSQLIFRFRVQFARFGLCRFLCILWVEVLFGFREYVCANVCVYVCVKHHDQ